MCINIHHVYPTCRCLLPTEQFVLCHKTSSLDRLRLLNLSIADTPLQSNRQFTCGQIRLRIGISQKGKCRDCPALQERFREYQWATKAEKHIQKAQKGDTETSLGGEEDNEDGGIKRLEVLKEDDKAWEHEIGYAWEEKEDEEEGADEAESEGENSETIKHKEAREEIEWKIKGYEEFWAAEIDNRGW